MLGKAKSQGPNWETWIISQVTPLGPGTAPCRTCLNFVRLGRQTPLDLSGLGRSVIFRSHSGTPALRTGHFRKIGRFSKTQKCI